jgi:hypothetical protein
MSSINLTHCIDMRNAIMAYNIYYVNHVDSIADTRAKNGQTASMPGCHASESRNYEGGEGVNTLCTPRVFLVKVGNYQGGLKCPRSTFRVAYDYLGTTWGTFGAWRGNLTPCVRF